jgi:hypothetical protein
MKSSITESIDFEISFDAGIPSEIAKSGNREIRNIKLTSPETAIRPFVANEWLLPQKLTSIANKTTRPTGW